MLFAMLTIQLIAFVVFVLCAELTSPLYLFKKWYTVATIIMYVAIAVFFVATIVGVVISIGL